MPGINIRCPHCQQLVEAPAEFAGKTVECPNCGKDIHIPPYKTKAPKKERSRSSGQKSASAPKQNETLSVPDKVMENKFFKFITPCIESIDDGRFFREPFYWLYLLMAIINLCIPFYLLYEAFNNGLFNLPGKFILVFVIVWLAMLVTSWFGFQIWWNRKNKIYSTSSVGDDFIVIPILSHFIQTLGECVGTWVALMGFVYAILGTMNYIRLPRLDLFNIALFSIILMPLCGFFIIIISRFFAEGFRALVSIANNTNNDKK